MLEVLVLVACILIWDPVSVNGATNQADASALQVMYSSLGSPGQLTGWKSNGGDPCGESWKGVVCSGSRVTELELSGLGLSGSMGYELSSLTSLKKLDISNNNLGDQIPYQLPPNVERLNLAGNQFGGGIPYSVSQMTSLKYLNANHNKLQGQLNDMFGKLSSLSTLDLSFNSLTGNLPQSFTSLSSMNTMNLQNNQFTGSINVLADLPLENLNVANNQFTGWIPSQLKKINNLQTGGNSWSTGPAPPPPPYTPPPSRKIDPGQNSGRKKSGIGGGGIAGIIISILVIGAIVSFFLLRRKPKIPSKEKHKLVTSPLASDESNDMKYIRTSSVDSKILQSSASFPTKPSPMDWQKSVKDDVFPNKPFVQKIKLAPISAKVYSIADLQMATGSFSIENLVGEGSVGRVYKAQLDDGKVLAVKKIDSSSIPNHTSEDFLDVVSNISQLHHPNVTKLAGYCCEHGQYLLVYEFHRNGTLHDYLHLSDEYSRPLTWNTRVKISLGIARALEYLHEVCSPSIIHKNFKSGNILLDMELNPHLSDCGLAIFVPNAEHQASEQNTSSGYSAPEVSMSGQYTLKSDVYSFGVVMLELLTGRKPFDSSRPRSEQSLVRWATPQLHDIDALAKMVDPALRGLYPPKSLSRFADVVALCVQSEPEFRPPMSEAVQALVRLMQRAMSNTVEEEHNRTDDSDSQEYMF